MASSRVSGGLVSRSSRFQRESTFCSVSDMKNTCIGRGSLVIGATGYCFEVRFSQDVKVAWLSSVS